MSNKFFNRHASAFYPEQPWFIFNAAQHYSLIVSDNPAVSHFYSFDVSDAAPLTLAIPDGCVDILFDCDATQPTARVYGTPLKARSFELIHNHHYFGIRFAPGVMPFFPDLSAEELIGQEFGFLDVIPEALELFEKITKNQSFAQQVAIFNDGFLPYLSCNPSTLTTKLIGAIRMSKGNLQVNQLEELTGYTSRTIHRSFRQDTGMSPKAFSRIIRCQSALYSLNQRTEISFLDLALELGFSDQPHFQREFKKLVSTTPLDYQKRITREAYVERIRYN